MKQVIQLARPDAPASPPPLTKVERTPVVLEVPVAFKYVQEQVAQQMNTVQSSAVPETPPPLTVVKAARDNDSEEYWQEYADEDEEEVSYAPDPVVAEPSKTRFETFSEQVEVQSPPRVENVSTALKTRPGVPSIASLFAPDEDVVETAPVLSGFNMGWNPPSTKKTKYTYLMFFKPSWLASDDLGYLIDVYPDSEVAGEDPSQYALLKLRNRYNDADGPMGEIRRSRDSAVQGTMFSDAQGGDPNGILAKLNVFVDTALHGTYSVRRFDHATKHPIRL